MSPTLETGVVFGLGPFIINLSSLTTCYYQHPRSDPDWPVRIDIDGVHLGGD